MAMQIRERQEQALRETAAEERTARRLRLQIEELEARIAPDTAPDPGPDLPPPS